MAKLSALAVSRAAGPAVLHDGGGLYLRVSTTGSKSWAYRYQIAGRRRDMGIGGFPDVSLAEARQRAASLRAQVRDNIDPLEAKRSQRRPAPRTFQECAAEYIAAHKAGWSKKHTDDFSGTLRRYAYPAIGALPVAAIDRPAILSVLEPLWSTRPVVASRLRARLEVILDAAAVRGYREEGPNPAAWRANLARIFPALAKVHDIAHHRAIGIDKVAEFTEALQGRSDMSARALELVILTATRAGEACGARWAEVDWKSKTWTIPAERMKAGREHRVPLSVEALSLLARVEPLARRPDGTLDAQRPVFPGIRPAVPITTNALFWLLRRRGRGDITVHGFRSTFRDWAAERTNFAREVAEMALAHRVGDATERAYQRSDLFDKRRQLMDAWGRFCTTPTTGGEVVPLHAAG
jgi:integrase